MTEIKARLIIACLEKLIEQNNQIMQLLGAIRNNTYPKKRNKDND